MTRSKLIGISAISLLLINISLLGFLVYGSFMDKKRHKEPKEIIIRKLNFNKQQINDYEILIKWHQSQVREKGRTIREIKQKLYSTLTAKADPKATDSLIQAIVDVQQDIEHIHYKHFADIRNLCKPEQLRAFNGLTQEIGALFAPKQPGKDH